jgi:hypothetical protein
MNKPTPTITKLPLTIDKEPVIPLSLKNTVNLFLQTMMNPNIDSDLDSSEVPTNLRRLRIHYHSRVDAMTLTSLSCEEMLATEKHLFPFTYESLLKQENKIPGFVRWFCTPVCIDAVNEDIRQQVLESTMELLKVDVYDEAGVPSSKLMDARANIAKTLLEATKEAPRTMPSYQASVTNNFLGLPQGAGSERVLRKVHVEDISNDLRRLQEVNANGDSELSGGGHS